MRERRLTLLFLQPNLNWRKREGRGRDGKETKGVEEGVRERQRQSKEFPGTQSLKTFMPPPIILTLFLGWAFLSFPLREVGTGAQPRHYPAGPSCNSQDQRTKANCWGDKGALCAYCSASMGFCLSPMLSCLTPTLTFRDGPVRGWVFAMDTRASDRAEKVLEKEKGSSWGPWMPKTNETILKYGYLFE